MKKNFYYLLSMMMVAMLCVGFTSCGDDDDDAGEPGGGGSATTLVGTWKLTKYEGVYPNGSTIEYDEDEIMDAYVQFKSNGKGGNYTAYYYEDGSLAEWDIEPFSWQYSGKYIVTYEEGDDEPVYTEVISLTSSELKIKDTTDLDDGLSAVYGTYKRVNDSVLAGAVDYDD